MRFLILFFVIATISLLVCSAQEDCKKDCSGVEKNIVCGADTMSDEFNPRDFDSECHMEMHNCENKTKFKKLFPGKCVVENYDNVPEPPATP